MDLVNTSEFKVLFVCTGNICRSPLGEFLLRDSLKSLHTNLSISSAGTHALIDGDIPEEIKSFSRTHNVEIEEHTPRQITAGMIGNADLVLTAERSHRSEVVSLVPRASAKTFTLNQFARLALQHEQAITEGNLAQPQVNHLSELITELADFRSIATPPEQPNYDDIDDPYRKSVADYQAAGEEILKTVDITAAILRKYSPR